MLFEKITIVDENFEIKENMYLGTKGDKIAYLSDKAPKEDFGEVYCGENRLLIPCFYNMHSHLPMVHMRGYGENLPLMTWLQEKVFPFEAHLQEKDYYYGELMGIAEMLRFGIGAASEMYLCHRPMGQALCESGVKANFCVCASCFDDSEYLDMPIHQKTLEAIKEFNNYDNGRIKVEFSLHAEYTSSEKTARGIAKAALEAGSSMHVHVSESIGEVLSCRERHNQKSPIEYLADCGLFDVPTVAAHCVNIDENDIAILKEHDVTVASCPKSNAKLASGVCPVKALLDAGVNVAIGTDSVASNNNLNMIEEMRFFNLLQKGILHDSTAITPAQTLYAATRAGAVGQRRFDSGLIKEGYKADITVFDTNQIYMKPTYNMLNNLIYSSSGNDVVLTMVDGKVLYKNGVYTTIDIEKVEYEFEKSRKRIEKELS